MCLLSFLLLSMGLAVHAIPLSRDTGKTSLALSAKVNTASTVDIVKADQARIQSMVHAGASLGKRSGDPVTATNNFIFYTVEVGVGTPPTSHTLMIDTGSSNTWIGANQSYTVTNSSVDTGNSFGIGYGSGMVLGEEWLDTITLASDLVIKNQSIGVATVALGTSGFDGILGVGPVDLTQGSVSNTSEVPTVADNLYAQKQISQEVLGIFFSPVAEQTNDGELTFGGYDNSLTTSLVTYAPITKAPGASAFWGIDQTISYGTTEIQSLSSGVVDTGTTLIYLSTNAYNQYQSLTGATLDFNTQLLSITSAQYANLQTLSFNIAGTSFDLTPNGQTWPRSLNTAINGNSSAIYLIVSDGGSIFPQGVDFINGYTFLQRFYSIYDTTNQRVGFAETKYTNSNIN